MHRHLFEEIDWSTERVFEQTKQRAAELNLRVHELATGLDVDDRASLARLRDELLENQRSSELAPNTQKILTELTAKARF
jgi:glycosyltransferase A (GT-A) superfamily protein (DUF2064 family)